MLSSYCRFFDKRRTDVSNITEFLSKYYKSDRYTGRGKEYAESLLNSYISDLKIDGYVIISRHESVTGEVVSFYINLPKITFNTSEFYNMCESEFEKHVLRENYTEQEQLKYWENKLIKVAKYGKEELEWQEEIKAKINNLKSKNQYEQLTLLGV
jgi:hypothetical protein